MIARMSSREVYAMTGSSTLADRKNRIYSELKYQYIDIPKLLYIRLLCIGQK